MRANDFKNKNKIKALKFSLYQTPHATIEPNRTCNIQCRSCYTLNRTHVKSLDEVKHEIDLAISKRNLQIITLLGGEPTIHPHITEIITYIKSKKLYCQLLTNGVVFLNDKNNTFLNKLIASGLDRILLHIDIGQNHIYKDIDAIRHTLFSKFENQRINFSLSITIYNENTCIIPTLIKKYSTYKFFDGLLAILARDPLPPKLQNAKLIDEYESISSVLNIEPVTYIPSNLNDKDVNWLIYFYYINADTGITFNVSPIHNRMLRKIYKLISGHNLFVIIINPLLYPITFFFTALLEIIIHPKKLITFFRILKHSNTIKSIRFHYIAIQTPPEFNHERNQYRLCYHCPDATIRNGMLTPVCVADLINPFDDGIKTEISEDLYQTSYKHLEEI